MYDLISFNGQSFRLLRLKNMSELTGSDITNVIMNQLQANNTLDQVQITLCDYSGKLFYKHTNDKLIVKRALKNVTPDSPDDVMQWLLDTIDKRRENQTCEPFILAVFAEMNKILVDRPTSRDVEQAQEKFKRILDEGPDVGIYVLATSLYLQFYTKKTGYSFHTFFTTKAYYEDAYNVFYTYTPELEFGQYLARTPDGEPRPFRIKK